MPRLTHPARWDGWPPVAAPVAPALLAAVLLAAVLLAGCGGGAGAPGPRRSYAPLAGTLLVTATAGVPYELGVPAGWTAATGAAAGGLDVVLSPADGSSARTTLASATGQAAPSGVADELPALATDALARLVAAGHDLAATGPSFGVALAGSPGAELYLSGHSGGAAVGGDLVVVVRDHVRYTLLGTWAAADARQEDRQTAFDTVEFSLAFGA